MITVDSDEDPIGTEPKYNYLFATQYVQIECLGLLQVPALVHMTK